MPETMNTLVYFVHADPVVRARYEAAVAATGIRMDLVFVNRPGYGSSVYRRLAAELRDADGRYLPNLFKRYRPPQPLEAYDVIVIVSFSAGYGLVQMVLSVPADAAELASVVSIDSWHTGFDPDGSARDEQLEDLVAFAVRAKTEPLVCCIGHSDVRTPQRGPGAFASTTQVAQELKRLTGLSGQGRTERDERIKSDVTTFGPDGGLRVKAYNLTSHPQREHSWALTKWGQYILADALVELRARREAAGIEDKVPDTIPAALTSRPTLRRGDEDSHSRDTNVQDWQHILIAAGYGALLAPWGADGSFGRCTYEATRAYQRARRLDPDGVVGPKTWGSVGQDIRPEDGPLEPPFPPLRNRDEVLGELLFEPVDDGSGNIHITNGWDADNVVMVAIPQLRGVYGAPPDGRIPFHQAAAAQLRALWQAWEDAGLLEQVLSWHGSWAPRFIRGSSSVLSNHAYASAFDINAAKNWIGQVPAELGGHGSVRELVPLAHEHGFYWGGHFSGRPDGMHFEAAKLIGV